MSDNTAFVLLVLTMIGAAVALIVTGHGAWVVGAIILLFLCIGG